MLTLPWLRLIWFSITGHETCQGTIPSVVMDRFTHIMVGHTIPTLATSEIKHFDNEWVTWIENSLMYFPSLLSTSVHLTASRYVCHIAKLQFLLDDVTCCCYHSHEITIFVWKLIFSICSDASKLSWFGSQFISDIQHSWCVRGLQQGAQDQRFRHFLEELY